MKERKLHLSSNKKEAEPLLIKRGVSSVDNRPQSIAQSKLIDSIHSSVSQQKLYRYKPSPLDTTLSPKETDAQKTAENIDACVEESYNEFLKGDFKGASDLQISLYALRKKDYDEGKKGMHPATAAGYVIEGKANAKIKEKVKNAITQDTGILKGTRPDITVELADGKFGLIDITAEKSVGHIFNKKGNWTGHKDIIYVAESAYSSINFKTMAKITLSPEMEQEILKRQETHELMIKENYEYWQDVYNTQQTSLRMGLFDFNTSNEIPFSGTERIRTAIINDFNAFGIIVKVGHDSKKIEEQSYVDYEVMAPDATKPYTINLYNAQELFEKLTRKKLPGFNQPIKW